MVRSTVWKDSASVRNMINWTYSVSWSLQHKRRSKGRVYFLSLKFVHLTHFKLTTRSTWRSSPDNHWSPTSVTSLDVIFAAIPNMWKPRFCHPLQHGISLSCYTQHIPTSESLGDHPLQQSPTSNIQHVEVRLFLFAHGLQDQTQSRLRLHQLPHGRHRQRVTRSQAQGATVQRVLDEEHPKVVEKDGGSSWKWPFFRA